MRVLILHFLKKNNNKHTEILKKLEQGASGKGHQVTVMNYSDAQNMHFAMYEYVAIVVNSASVFTGKAPEKLPEVMASCGPASGIKGCALVVKSGFLSQKLCRNTMRVMEKEGMVLDYFDVIESVDHATAVGKKIG